MWQHWEGVAGGSQWCCAVAAVLLVSGQCICIGLHVGVSLAPRGLWLCVSVSGVQLVLVAVC